MDHFLRQRWAVNKKVAVTVKESVRRTYLELKLQDPVLAKLVFGFSLENGESVSYPTDIGKMAFPLYVPVVRYGSLLLNEIANGGMKCDVDFLLKEVGHDLGANEYQGKTALHYALQTDNLSLISSLVFRPCSLLSVPIEVNLSDETCEFILKQPNVLLILESWFPGPMKEKLIEKLIAAETGIAALSALHRSICLKNEGLSLFLLRHLSKDSWLVVNVECGTNALHFALQAGLLEVLKVLILEKKMDLTVTDGQGRPSLSWLHPSFKKELIWFLISLPNWDAIKTANQDTYFVKNILPKYEEDLSLLKVCLHTASLFAEEKLDIHFLAFVQTLNSMTELKKSIETGSEYLQTPKMKKFMAECLHLYF